MKPLSIFLFWALAIIISWLFVLSTIWFLVWVFNCDTHRIKDLTIATGEWAIVAAILNALFGFKNEDE